jgi:hypothetical protein
MKERKAREPETPAPLQEGVDYYFDAATGLLVMAAGYLLRRGYCCGNGCRHCPYTEKEERET